MDKLYVFQIWSSLHYFVRFFFSNIFYTIVSFSMVHCVYDSHKTSILILIIISCVASYFRVLNSNFGCSVTFIFPSDSSFPSPYRRLLIRPIYTHTIYIYGWLILFGFFFFHSAAPTSPSVIRYRKPAGGKEPGRMDAAAEQTADVW